MSLFVNAPHEGAANPSAGPFDLRYSLPALLLEVKRDRASSAFSMEKLDQPAINLLFAHKRSRREASPQ